jgi:hypothetical protein
MCAEVSRPVVVVGAPDIIREVESENSVEVVTGSAVVEFWGKEVVPKVYVGPVSGSHMKLNGKRML